MKKTKIIRRKRCFICKKLCYQVKEVYGMNCCGDNECLEEIKELVNSIKESVKEFTATKYIRDIIRKEMNYKIKHHKMEIKKAAEWVGDILDIIEIQLKDMKKGKWLPNI